MTIQSDLLKSGAEEFGININDIQIKQFEKYTDILIEWNKKTNLTAITEPNEIAIKHFVDSISLLKYLNISQNSTLIDVGTGAGFPGIPIKIIRPDINLTLLDSLNKRIIFLNYICNEIGINSNTVHIRAEDGGRIKNMREMFDVAVARAVAPMNVLSEYLLPYVKVGGVFVAMKGPSGEEETKKALLAIEELGGSIDKIHSFELQNLGKRTIIIIKKTRSIAEKYPRNSGKIKKTPL